MEESTSAQADTHCYSSSSVPRSNPFSVDKIETSTNFITEQYLSNHVEDATSPDVYFSDPFIKITANSDIPEIEDAISKCKHMFLAASNEAPLQKQRLMARLIELRAILHTVREKSLLEINGKTFGRRRLMSETVFNSSSDSSELSSASVAFAKSIVVVQKGHEFSSNFVAKEWGSVCESCCKNVYGSIKKILTCEHCGIVLHWADNCLQGLTRVCPAEHLTGAMDYIDPLKIRLLSHNLDVKHIHMFDANLPRQSWCCMDCGRGLSPTQPSIQSALFKQALEQEVNVDPRIRTVVAEADKQFPALNCSPKATPIDPEWAANFCEDIGPLQTTNDALVHAAVSRYRRNTEKILDVPRYCHYSGMFFCSRCMWDDRRVIPSYIFFLSDTQARPVCRASVLRLDYFWSSCLFRAPDAWISRSQDALAVTALRLRLSRLRLYVVGCLVMRDIKQSILETDPDWLLEQPYTYNMFMVESVLHGDLVMRLKTYLEQFQSHMTSDCGNCAKFNSCCKCSTHLLGSDYGVSLCGSCNQFFHRNCPIGDNQVLSMEQEVFQSRAEQRCSQCSA